MGVAALYTGVSKLFHPGAGMEQTLVMGGFNGLLYLMGFVLLQVNVKKNGVVLSATFMKLGLLVPMVVSVCLFGERPELFQIIGFVIAVAAIILINFEKDESAMEFRAGLILLLLSGGGGDAMSKVFEELGNPEQSSHFLFYTFVFAFLLCLGLMIWKKERPGRAEAIYGLLIGVPNYFSARFLLRALEYLPAVIAYPTYSVATILAVTMVGLMVFRERLGKRQWTAIGAILVALVLLNL
jgi:drug/metabolite transporter (DMT)-like permease